LGEGIGIRLANNNRCGSCHASCLYSTYLPAMDSASLIGSTRESANVLLRSSRSNIFGGYVFFDKDIAWT